ncbi:MAG: hypothetical protein JWM27_2779 [Gemmatimonadetes bacterium]|nr:hypothetical protein [Gemmatimonadota bacterium]
MRGGVGVHVRVFQPTLPRGERRSCGWRGRPCSRGFNPRSRAGSDLPYAPFDQRVMAFQPTLPRGERHYRLNDPRYNKLVSTHAPARGATAAREGARGVVRVSTHAPARGATWRSRCPRSCCACFNPRSRAGSDTPKSGSRLVWELFQPTLPRGERQFPVCQHLSWVRWFQPTLPRGERRDWYCAPGWYETFQPTLPRGERPTQTLHALDLSAVSTHAPARGATRRPAEPSCTS